MISRLLIVCGISVLGLMASEGTVAQEIALNDAMVTYCEAQGIAPGACQCWFAKLSTAEGFSEFSAQDIQDLAQFYQEELVGCQADDA